MQKKWIDLLIKNLNTKIILLKPGPTLKRTLAFHACTSYASRVHA